MDCYEAVSGARMHANYYRPGGVLRDLRKLCPSAPGEVLQKQPVSTPVGKDLCWTTLKHSPKAPASLR